MKAGRSSAILISGPAISTSVPLTSAIAPIRLERPDELAALA